MKNVLLIDDDPEFLSLAARILKKRGIEVILADCTQAARAALKGERIDAVFLDIVLGRENGWETLRQLRELSPVPILLMSGGDVNDEMRIDAQALGAQDIIQKPFDWDGVVKKLSLITGF